MLRCLGCYLDQVTVLPCCLQSCGAQVTPDLVLLTLHFFVLVYYSLQSKIADVNIGVWHLVQIRPSLESDAPTLVVKYFLRYSLFLTDSNIFVSQNR